MLGKYWCKLFVIKKYSTKKVTNLYRVANG